MAYTERQLKRIRRELGVELERLKTESHSLERSLTKAAQQESGSELTDYDDHHPADAASGTYDREKDLALDENLMRLIGKVERAIEKLDEGTYGTCDRCGTEISAGRLKALPYAGMCVKCQDAVE